MTKTKRTPEEEYEGFDAIYQKIITKIDNEPQSSLVGKSVGALLLAITLAVIGSIPLNDWLGFSWWIWVATIIAFPAGVILFILLLVAQRRTKIKEWKMFTFKQNNSHLQRINKISISAVFVAFIFILFGHYLPYGVGGMLMVTIVLIGYNLIRRTKDEYILASQGIIDPRDIKSDGTIPDEAVFDLTPEEDNKQNNTDIQGGEIK